MKLQQTTALFIYSFCFIFQRELSRFLFSEQINKNRQFDCRLLLILLGAYIFNYLEEQYFKIWEQGASGSADIIAWGPIN